MYTRETHDSLIAKGYEGVAETAAPNLRLYGVPLLTNGMMPTPKRHPYYAKKWALQLINDWPYSSWMTEDPDHHLLKKVIRHAMRIGGEEFALMAATVARLGGPEKVEELLEGAER